MSVSSPEWSPTIVPSMNVERKYSELRTRYNRIRNERDEQMERIEELEKEVNACFQKMDELQRQLDTSRRKADRLDAIEEEHVRVGIERDTLAHELQRSKTELDRQKSMCYDMKRKYDEMSELLRKLDDENETLKSTCSELNRQLSDERQYAEYAKKCGSMLQMKMIIGNLQQADDYECKLSTTKEHLQRMICQESAQSVERHEYFTRILKLENDLQGKMRLFEKIQSKYRIDELEHGLQNKEEQLCIQQFMHSSVLSSSLLAGVDRSPAGPVDEVTAHDLTGRSTSFEDSAALSLHRTVSSAASSSSSLYSCRSAAVSSSECGSAASEAPTETCQAGASKGGFPPPSYDEDDVDSCLKYIRQHREQWHSKFAGTPPLSTLSTVVLDMESVKVNGTLSHVPVKIAAGSSSSSSGWCGRWLTSMLTGGGVVVFLLVSVGVATVWTMHSHMHATHLHRD